MQGIDSAFTDQSNLIKHKKEIHMKITNHKCKHCEMSFSRSTELRTHENAVHLNIKNFVCNECGHSLVGLRTGISNCKCHFELMHSMNKDAFISMGSMLYVVHCAIGKHFSTFQKIA